MQRAVRWSLGIFGYVVDDAFAVRALVEGFVFFYFSIKLRGDFDVTA